MKNILKIGFVLMLCLSLLLVAGCSKESDEKKNQETTNNAEDEMTLPVVSNPEGEAYDDYDVGAEDEPVVEGPDETNPETEPPVGVDNSNEDEGGDDFEVDFGELAG